MQTRSIRGSGEPAWVSASLNASANRQRCDDPDPVRKPPHQHSAECVTAECEGKGKRRSGAVNTKISLDCRQRNHRRPHPYASDRAKKKGYGQPKPGVWRSDYRRAAVFIHDRCLAPTGSFFTRSATCHASYPHPMYSLRRTSACAPQAMDGNRD